MYQRLSLKNNNKNYGNCYLCIFKQSYVNYKFILKTGFYLFLFSYYLKMSVLSKVKLAFKRYPLIGDLNKNVPKYIMSFPIVP